MPLFENGTQVPDEEYVAYIMHVWGYSLGEAWQLVAIENGDPTATGLVDETPDNGVEDEE